jgi:hypothetical protein
MAEWFPSNFERVAEQPVGKLEVVEQPVQRRLGLTVDDPGRPVPERCPRCQEGRSFDAVPVH